MVAECGVAERLAVDAAAKARDPEERGPQQTVHLVAQPPRFPSTNLAKASCGRMEDGQPMYASSASRDGLDGWRPASRKSHVNTRVARFEPANSDLPTVCRPDLGGRQIVHRRRGKAPEGQVAIEPSSDHVGNASDRAVEIGGAAAVTHDPFGS